MNRFKLVVIILCLTLVGLAFPSGVKADAWNKKTTVTFSQPVEIPGVGAHVLPAGKYVFKLMDSLSDRNIVQIFNAGGTELFATVQTIPTERATETDGTSITLAQGQDAQPPALVTWFYPGTETGHEFIYSKPVETELSQEAKRTLVDEHGTMVNSDANGEGN